MGLRAESNSNNNKRNRGERSTSNSNNGRQSRANAAASHSPADCPNEVYTDAMAPALPESVSASTTNLSGVNAKTDAAAVKRNNKKSNLVENKATTDSTASLAVSTTTNKRSSRGSSALANTTPPSTSTRVTRSKDAKQRTLTATTNATTTAKTILPNGATQDIIESNLVSDSNDKTAEQMGLSVALNNNNEKDATAEQECDKDAAAANKQLLADLSQNFEGAINAEIVLRNQLDDVNLSKNESETKEVLFIKAGSGGAPEAEAAANTNTQTHMESIDVNNSIVEDKHETATTTATKQQKNKIVELPANVVSRSGAEQKRVQSEGLHVISVEELPAISTDSTITASEIGDNIEERLSQLEGIALPDETLTPAEESSLTQQHVSPTKTVNQLQLHQQLKQSLQQSPSAQQRIFSSPSNLQSQLQASQCNTIAALTGTGTVNATTVDIDHDDIEEVLKVLKGIEGAQGTDSINELNAFLNEVYPYCEDVANQQTATAGNVSSGGSYIRMSPLKESRLELDKKDQVIGRKADNLVNRLRKIQARYMCKHSSVEIAGLFELCSRQATKHLAPGQKADNNANSILQSVDMKPTVSSKQLSTLLRRIESTASAQQLSTTPTGHNNSANKFLLKKINKRNKDGTWPGNASNIAATTAATSVQSSDRKYTDLVVPTLKPEYVAEVDRVSGFLKTQLRQVQNAIDSDATESSSGGESADEMISYNNPNRQQMSICKRAAMIYSRDRGAIASRWTWILSQVADLEIKIRQHAELKHDIMRSQGPIILLPPAGAATATTANDAAIISLNGYKSEHIAAGLDAKEIFEESCCRTRAFPAAQFRKRKLLPTNNIHTISKKAARPSNIKCGCQWPHMPCALCTGRADPTAPRDLMDTMMLSERAALLDPGFHPVLSFEEDIDLSIRNESYARSSEWQQRNMRILPKSLLKSALRNERDISAGLGLNSQRKYGMGAAVGGDHPPIQKRRYRKRDRSVVDEVMTAAGSDTGNGTGTLSTSTTPLAANRMAKNLLNPFSESSSSKHNNPIQHSGGSNSRNKYKQRISEHAQQAYDQCNLIQARSSLISNTNNSSSSKHNRYRNKTAYSHANHHHNIYNSHLYNDNFLHTNEHWESSSAMRSRTSSPTHNHQRYERSKNRNSYDIDNIVIPYSVAAATRVEILPYKEIPTPTWRIVEQKEIFKDSCKYAVCNGSTETENEMLPSSTPQTNATDNTNESVKKENNILKPNNISNIVETPNEANEQQPEKNVNGFETAVAKEKIEDEAETEKEIEQKTLKSKENLSNDSDKFVIVKEEITTELPNRTAAACSVETAKSNTNTKADNDRVEDDKISKNGKFHSKFNMEEAFESETAAAAPNIANEIKLEDDEEAEIKSLKDEVFMLRHELKLLEERRKFASFLRFPWSTRSRANRRSDSRAESSGANTPDLSSPAPQTPLTSADQESIPSPLAPATPINPLDSIPENGEANAISASTPMPVASFLNCISKRYERRRTTSAKNKEQHVDRRSATPDPREYVAPYEPRQYPLRAELYESMLQEMPIRYQNEVRGIKDNSDSIVDIEECVRKDASLENDEIADKMIAARKRKHTSLSEEKVESDCDMYDNVEQNVSALMLDDYTKHYLEPRGEEFDDQYAAYVGGESNALDSNESGSETEPDPFQDDDPNDPEWRGEAERSERAERPRYRRKL